MGAWRFTIFLTVMVVLSVGQRAHAEDVIIPYSCEMTDGQLSLSASGPNLYHIIGQRQDLPFSFCSPASGACEMMTLNKFNLECAGQKVAWSRIAAAARDLGADLPSRLPAGYAPVKRLGGRFVPSEALAGPPRKSQVAVEELLPVNFIEEAGAKPRHPAANWTTVVEPDALVAGATGAGKVAGVVGFLLVTLVGTCLLLTRRAWADGAAFPRNLSEAGSTVANAFKSVIDAIGDAFRHSYESWRASAEPGGGASGVEHVLDVVHTRLADVDMMVASLPESLLLRDVLSLELDGLRDRAADVARRAGRLGGERASGILRNVLRDLDRIQRIVHSAAPNSDARQSNDTVAPNSIAEAYRILGLNPDAPDLAVKKIVDALRLSWHPDHARNELDRRTRESRIKQINAAWDLLKGERAQAA